jgi:phage regulator Rha-like protein
MSSREIAELTGKRHDNVMADIRKMLIELDCYAPEFSGTYQTDQGNEYKCFNLPKRECLILVSGYDVQLRARIIDRWQDWRRSFPQIPPGGARVP